MATIILLISASADEKHFFTWQELWVLQVPIRLRCPRVLSRLCHPAVMERGEGRLQARHPDEKPHSPNTASHPSRDWSACFATKTRMNHPRSKKHQVISPRAADMSVGQGFANNMLFSCLPLTTSFSSCLMLPCVSMQGWQRWQSRCWHQEQQWRWHSVPVEEWCQLQEGVVLQPPDPCSGHSYHHVFLNLENPGLGRMRGSP